VNGNGAPFVASAIAKRLAIELRTDAREQVVVRYMVNGGVVAEKRLACNKHV
jgi:hypothetical protein